MNQETLMKHITYDPETGHITRISRKNSNGSIDAYGYLILKIEGTQYKAHRLAWLCAHGSMPDGVIDHINGIKTDNRISNLRVVSQAENCRNATVREHPETGLKGIRIDRTNGLKKQYATRVLGKVYRFLTPEEATQFRETKLKGAGYGERHI